MNSRAENLSRELSRYQEEWVALSSDEKRVIAHDLSLKKALEEAHQKGEPRPVMLKVLSSSKIYAF